MTEISKGTTEFSLVSGGPVHRLFCFLNLSDADLAFTSRRIAVICGITWLPLLLLSLFEGHIYTDAAEKPFLRDIEAHIRFLVALPLLLAAETVTHQVLDPRIGNFLTRHIIRDADLPEFQSAIKSTHRIRDSVVIESILIAVVFSLGAFIYRRGLTTTLPTWNIIADGTGRTFTIAGYWMAFVSVPIFQFFLIRWYLRILNWSLFLWRISRLNLNLIATHADRSAGIGFLAKTTYSFAYFLLAHGALLSAHIANLVMNNGEPLMSFKLEAGAFVALFLMLVFGPLTVFTPQLIAAKWQGGGIFGNLISQYIEDFNQKWTSGDKAADERPELLGTPDIQSLADIGNSFVVVEQMRTVPFNYYDVVYLGALTLIPLVPLLLFVFSLEELVEKLISILF